MKAVILAGGKGSRLGEQGIPKVMQKIGDYPILEHQLLLLKKYGFKEIVLLTGYLHDQIENFFGSGRDLGLSITYHQDPAPLGTAGAVKAIENKLETDFLLLFGDIMIQMNLEKLVQYHQDKRSFCTCVVHPNDHPADSDLVKVDRDHRITSFLSKPHPQDMWYGNLANAALFVVSPGVTSFIPANKKLDFGKDILPLLIKEKACYAYRTREYLKDMGSPDRIAHVRDDYTSGKITKSVENKKAVFLDRDGVINADTHLVSKPEDFILLPSAAAAIKRINHSGYLAVVVTNQPVVARNLCTEEELVIIHNKMETLLGRENAFLDRIYYCPHHPDKGFAEENPMYKIICDCRKPGTGMIRKAQEELDILLPGSYMIGDRENDMICGKNAGLHTILITIPGLTPVCQADYHASNLAEAVAYIAEQEEWQ